MSKGKTTLLIFAGLVLALSIVTAVEISDIEKICYRMGGYKLLGFTDAAGNRMAFADLIDALLNKKQIFVDMEIYIKIHDPLKVDVDINGYNFNVSVNDIKVANIKTKQKQKITGGGNTTLTIPVKIDLQYVNKVLNNDSILTYFAYQQWDKIKIGIDGSINGGIIGIFVNKKISTSMTLADLQKEMKTPSAPCVT